MAFIRASDAPALPIQAVHVLRTALLRREDEQEEPADAAAVEPTQGEEKREQEEKDTAERRKRRRLIASLNAGQIAKAIIKNEAADRRMHVLAIARRLHYCLTG
jgi:hypothetical protein